MIWTTEGHVGRVALSATFLADKSALATFPVPAVSQRLRPLLEEGLIATCTIIDLEVLYSSRSLSDYEAVLEERRSLEVVLHYDADFERIAAVGGAPQEWVVPQGSI